MPKNWNLLTHGKHFRKLNCLRTPNHQHAPTDLFSHAQLASYVRFHFTTHPAPQWCTILPCSNPRISSLMCLTCNRELQHCWKRKGERIVPRYQRQKQLTNHFNGGPVSPLIVDSGCACARRLVWSTSTHRSQTCNGWPWWTWAMAIPGVNQNVWVNQGLTPLHHVLTALDIMVPGWRTGSNDAPHPQNVNNVWLAYDNRVWTHHRVNYMDTTNYKKYVYDIKFDVVLKEETKTIPGKTSLIKALMTIKNAKRKQEKIDLNDTNGIQTAQTWEG